MRRCTRVPRPPRARLPIPRAHLRLALADDNVAENSGGAELGDADARDDHVDAVRLPPCERTISERPMGTGRRGVPGAFRLGGAGLSVVRH